MNKTEITQEWPWHRTALQVTLNLILGLLILEEIATFLEPGDWNLVAVLMALSFVGVGLAISSISGVLYLRRRSSRTSLKSITTTPPVLVWIATSACFLTVVLWIFLTGQTHQPANGNPPVRAIGLLIRRTSPLPTTYQYRFGSSQQSSILSLSCEDGDGLLVERNKRLPTHPTASVGDCPVRKISSGPENFQASFGRRFIHFDVGGLD